MITANLPAIDFEQTQRFYEHLGFECDYRSDEWMIMNRDGMLLEFFHHPELDPKQSWHSACIRVENMEHYFQEWKTVAWQNFSGAAITEIEHLDEISLFCIIDMNGSLLRCIQQ
ncbi:MULTISPECIES: VOC family protein [Acinetobacter]|uniref:hypothetical protein n=1 Tax=Acinetobacter TaxID=469 RepID=UPI000B3C6DC5|nr:MULTISPECIES: hypothetical protein [Acinetobacter]AXY61692.1 hypothetical protein CDG61_05450 [Acinetobacter sp. WCHAc010052]WOE42518.1 hypothetical protein QSG87_05140 [Acinetobacter chinensis]